MLLHLQLHFIWNPFFPVYFIVFKQVNIMITKKESYILGLNQKWRIIFSGIVFLDYIFGSDFNAPGHAPTYDK